eukprot:2216608-Pyramimonas_sp.AAC.1
MRQRLHFSSDCRPPNKRQVITMSSEQSQVGQISQFDRYSTVCRPASAQSSKDSKIQTRNRESTRQT